MLIHATFMILCATFANRREEKTTLAHIHDSEIIQNHESEGKTGFTSAGHSGTTHFHRMSIHHSIDIDWVKHVHPHLCYFFLVNTYYDLRIKNFRPPCRI